VKKEEAEILLADKEIDEAINILNDPLALSLAVKDQYEKVTSKNKNEDISLINPLAQGDDQNTTTQYYEKQQVYQEEPSQV